jgi:hypothetical protein
LKRARPQTLGRDSGFVCGMLRPCRKSPTNVPAFWFAEKIRFTHDPPTGCR